MAYWTAGIPMTSSDFRDHLPIALLHTFWNGIFVQLCSSWQDLNWRNSSCGCSVIGEIFVLPHVGFFKMFPIHKHNHLQLDYVIHIFTCFLKNLSCHWNHFLFIYVMCLQWRVKMADDELVQRQTEKINRLQVPKLVLLMQ